MTRISIGSAARAAAEWAAAGGQPRAVRRVASLLKAQGFSLQANSKQTEGSQHPDRDRQFAYLAEQVSAHTDAGEPVISVDTKKKELVGDFKNGGAEYRPTGNPEPVRVHDFTDPALGKVNTGQGQPVRHLRHFGQRQLGERGHRP